MPVATGTLYQVLAEWFGTPKGIGALIVSVTVIALFAAAFQNYKPGEYTDSDDAEHGGDK